MPASLEPQVTDSQGLIVTTNHVTIGSMNREAEAFAARLNAVVDENGFPPKGSGRQGALAKRYGVSQKGARKWLEGEAIPKMSRIYEIAKDMSINAEWLLTGRGEKYSGPVPRVAEPGADYDTRRPIVEVRKVPVISSIQAGDWAEAYEAFEPGFAEDWRSTSASVSDKAFMLKVTGDSMAAPTGLSIPEGAFVLVDPESAADNGKIVVAKLTDSNEVTLKKLVLDGPNTYLKPLNPDYRMIEINGNCEIIGVVKKVEIDV